MLTADSHVTGYLVARDEGIAVRDLAVTVFGEIVLVKYQVEPTGPRADRRSTDGRVVVDAA